MSEIKIIDKNLGEVKQNDIGYFGIHKDIINAIEQLQRENEELKDKINNFNLEIEKWLFNSKAEMCEYGDNHEKYWEMFNQLLKKIKNKLVDISDYAVIDRDREEKLLNKEDILTEFEKWLEEKINSPKLSLIEIITFKRCLEELQELKEKNNATTN